MCLHALSLPLAQARQFPHLDPFQGRAQARSSGCGTVETAPPGGVARVCGRHQRRHHGLPSPVPWGERGLFLQRLRGLRDSTAGPGEAPGGLQRGHRCFPQRGDRSRSARCQARRARPRHLMRVSFCPQGLAPAFLPSGGGGGRALLRAAELLYIQISTARS